MNLQRIVVGLDGSRESARALDVAIDLAVLADAEITAVSVFDAGPYMSFGVAPTLMPDFAVLRADLETDLHAWCEPLRSQSIRHRTVVRDGGAALEILKEADAQGADLVVVGTRGRGGVRELLMGSVAHHVSQHSRHPVLVVPRLAVAAPAALRVAAVSV